jgi:hypothetical protein
LPFTIASSRIPHYPSSTSNDSRTKRTNETNIRSSATLAGGGSEAKPGGHTVAGFEQFELVDYTGIAERREQKAQYTEREARRAKNIRRLDEQDEMKFSHSIQFNAVPDWSSHYIAYSNLKKLYVPCRSP